MRFLGTAGLAGEAGVPKPRVRSSSEGAAGEMVPGAAGAEPVAPVPVVGVEGLNSTPGAGSVLTCAALVELLAGLGLAATTAAGLDPARVVENAGRVGEVVVGLDVGDASTMRMGSSGELVVTIVLRLAVGGDKVAELPRAAGDAVISLRIVPPREEREGFVGGVTIGGSVLAALPVELVLDSAAPAAGC